MCPRRSRLVSTGPNRLDNAPWVCPSMPSFRSGENIGYRGALGYTDELAQEVIRQRKPGRGDPGSQGPVHRVGDVADLNGPCHVQVLDAICMSTTRTRGRTVVREFRIPELLAPSYIGAGESEGFWPSAAGNCCDRPGAVRRDGGSRRLDGCPAQGGGGMPPVADRVAPNDRPGRSTTTARSIRRRPASGGLSDATRVWLGKLIRGGQRADRAWPV